MKFSKTKFAIITIVCALFALATGQKIWPPSPMIPMPAPKLMPYFIGVAVMEAIAFGVGISFFLFMWPIVRRKTGSAFIRAFWAYIAFGWMLVSWWPHDNLHYHIGHDAQQLLYVEYGFHVTLILATFVLVSLSLATIFRDREKGER